MCIRDRYRIVQKANELKTEITPNPRRFEVTDSVLNLLFSDLDTVLAITNIEGLWADVSTGLWHIEHPTEHTRDDDRVGRLIMLSISNIKAANLLGLLQHDPEEWFSGGISDEDNALAAQYDTVRAQAMAAKAAGDKAAMGEAFKASDAIRDKLTAKGLVIESSADGTSKLRKA